MYTVPVGQNPCGTVGTCGDELVPVLIVRARQNMSAERKKAIYDICVKFGTLDRSPY